MLPRGRRTGKGDVPIATAQARQRDAQPAVRGPEPRLRSGQENHRCGIGLVAALVEWYRKHGGRVERAAREDIRQSTAAARAPRPGPGVAKAAPPPVGTGGRGDCPGRVVRDLFSGRSVIHREPSSVRPHHRFPEHCRTSSDIRSARPNRGRVDRRGWPAIPSHRRRSPVP